MKVLVIGAGPAGIFAALTAARSNHQVTILEQKDIIGKKITATGNGKCNLGNTYMKRECYHGDAKLLSSVFDVVSQEDTLAYLREMGIFIKDKNGYLYPYSESAASVRKAMELALLRANVEIVTSVKINSIKKTTDFMVSTNVGDFTSQKLILATGLLASPVLGSDGSLFSMIEGLGHHFTGLTPALCGFYAEGLPFEALAGVRAEGTVALSVDGQFVEDNTGEIQFTEYGISGIPVFQISSLAARAILEGKKVQVGIDLFPRFTKSQWEQVASERRSQMMPEDKILDFFLGFLPPKLASGVLSVLSVSKKTRMKDISDSLFAEIVSLCKNVSIQLTDTRDYSNAQICTGGIVSEEIHRDTLESKLVLGLYFAGELLDVDGICGGYNLQWAFRSGMIAGRLQTR